MGRQKQSIVPFEESVVESLQAGDPALDFPASLAHHVFRAVPMTIRIQAFVGPGRIRGVRKGIMAV